MTRSQAQAYAPITALLLVAFLLLTIRLDTPWTGHHDENGSWISSAVRNYALYGAEELGYLQVINRGPATPETLQFYVHHPPLIVWSATIFTELFGRYDDDQRPFEAAVRLVSVYATLISIAAFYVIARRLFKSPRQALWTAALYAFTPMILYYGRMPNHEPLALVFIMVFVAIYINWMKQPTWGRWLAMAALAGLTMWTAWAGAFIFAGFGIATMIVGGNIQRRQMVALGAVTIALTVAVPLFYEAQREGSITALQEAFGYRTSNQEFSRGSESFTATQFIGRQLTHVIPLMTPIVFSFGIWGLWLVNRRRATLQQVVILGLLGGALGYMLVFRNAHYIHDYYKIYWSSGAALAASVAIAEGLRVQRRGLKRYLRPLTVSMLLVSAVGAVYFWQLMITSGEGTITIELADTLANASQEDTYIATHLPYENSAVEYYSFRQIAWEQSPSAFYENVQQRNQSALYLYCPVDFLDVEPLPVGLSQLPAEPALDEQCQLIFVEANG